MLYLFRYVYVCACEIREMCVTCFGAVFDSSRFRRESEATSSTWPNKINDGRTGTHGTVTFSICSRQHGLIRRVEKGRGRVPRYRHTSPDTGREVPAAERRASGTETERERERKRARERERRKREGRRRKSRKFLNFLRETMGLVKMQLPGS